MAMRGNDFALVIGADGGTRTHTTLLAFIAVQNTSIH